MSGIFNPGKGSAGVSGVLTTTIQVNAAQMLALGTSPIQVLPAPGVGNIIVPIFFVVRYTFGTHVYDGAVNSHLSLFPEGFFSTVEYFTLGPLNVGGSSSFVWAGLAGPVGEINNINASNTRLLFGGNNLISGSIATSTLGAGGLGYAPGDTGNVNTGDGDAVYVIDTVGGGGAVLTYHFSNTGTGYITGNGQATSVLTGGGNGAFTVNINSVTPGDGNLGLTVGYQIVAVP